MEPNAERKSQIISANACFVDEISESDVGVSLNVCYNCSTCTTSCPVALETEGRFNPRTIIQLASCGNQDRVILDNRPNVWDCAMCEICQEVCPQGVDLHHIFVSIKNTAAEFDNIPSAYSEETKQVYEFGKSIPLQTAIEKRRSQLGLPPIIAVDSEEVKKLLDINQKLMKIIHKETK